MKSDKLIVGLTGYYCSGKSTVESILKEKYNFFPIDVDKEGHFALNEKKDLIVEKFGDEVLLDNQINRKVLSKIVFSDPDKLMLLNSIVHPVMVENIKKIIDTSNSKRIVINAALLFQMGLDVICSFVIFVKAPIFTIIHRGIKRDKRKLFEIIKILEFQKKFAFDNKNFKNVDIYYVKNSRDKNSLINAVDYIIRKMELPYGK